MAETGTALSVVEAQQNIVGGTLVGKGIAYWQKHLVIVHLKY